MVSIIGGIAGILLAWWTFDLVVGSVPAVFALLLPDALDSRAVAFSALATVCSMLLFGAAPALRSSRTDLIAGLQERRRGSTSRRWTDGRLLLAAETMVATVLVISAVVMVGSFGRLRHAAMGFEPDRLLSVNVQNSRGVPRSRIRGLLMQLANDVRRLPGVVSVAVEDVNPVGVKGYRAEAERLLPGARPTQAQRVGAGYLETMRMQLVAGRFPTDAEWQHEGGSAVITERAARVFGGRTQAIGKTFELRNGGRATIDGVVGDVRLRYDDREPREMIFLPLHSNRWSAPGLLVRTSEDHTRLAHQIHAIVTRADPRAISKVAPVLTLLDGSLALPRFQASLLGLFSMLAVLLAAVGIHGVLAQVVAGRTREIGIRMALGATPGSVRRLVISYGVTPVVMGLAVGALAGFWVVQAFKSYVHGIEVRDPWFFAVAAVIVMTAAFAATWIPARRATRIDPVATLRAE